MSSLAALAVALLVQLSRAQIVSTAACLPSKTWMHNSLGQSPCLLAAYLSAPCSGDESFVIEPLPGPGHYYTGTASGTWCHCSTVTYSLVAACGDCQGGGWASWGEWSSKCTQDFRGYYPYYYSSRLEGIPAIIPEWAFVFINDGTGNWNSTVAYANAMRGLPDRIPFDGPVPSTPPNGRLAFSTGGLSSVGPSPSASSSASPPAQPSSSTSKSTPVGAIVGGVVGGVLGLALIVGFFMVLLRRTKPATTQPPPPTSTAQLPYATMPEGHSPPANAYRLYNPDDPSTYPAASRTPPIYPSPPSSNWNNEQNPYVPRA